VLSVVDSISLQSLLAWWLTVWACGLLGWPIASLLLGRESDGGYIAGKLLGLLIAGYTTWLALLTGLLPSGRSAVYAGLAALLLGSGAAARLTCFQPRLRNVFTQEAAFGLLLVIGVTLRITSPDIEGLEKFMDFGFVNASLRATAMPPEDPWWAGASINYYYFGHYITAWLIRVSGVPADHGYNLMIGTLFALAASLAFRVIRSVTANTPVSRIAAAIGAVLVVVGGNFHSVLYGPLRSLSPTTLDRGYRFADSARYFGYDPDTKDKAFTEMPAYSFAVGDLHAHLLNFPTVLLFVLVVAAWLKVQLGSQGRHVESTAVVMALGFLLAVAAMTNTWDTISMGILLGVAKAAAWIAVDKVKLGRLPVRLVMLLLAVGLSLILAAPFLATFTPISSQVLLSATHTRAWQWLIVHGHMVLPCLMLLAILLHPRLRKPAWLPAAVIGAAALIMLAVPELAFVKDIYRHEFRRANTMFKFAFVAQPLGMIASVALIAFLVQSGQRLIKVAGLALALPVCAVLVYADALYRDRLAELIDVGWSLDGLRFVEKKLPGEHSVVAYLKQLPITSNATLIEADGDSYSLAGRLSALTGVPSVLGWHTHEWLWRGDKDAVERRKQDVAAFYSASVPSRACEIASKYGVTHFMIGAVERDRFSNLKSEVLEQIGRPVVSTPGARLFELHCTDSKMRATG
jgi:uncharacterized membrane protein